MCCAFMAVLPCTGRRCDFRLSCDDCGCSVDSCTECAPLFLSFHAFTCWASPQCLQANAHCCGDHQCLQEVSGARYICAEHIHVGPLVQLPPERDMPGGSEKLSQERYGAVLWVCPVSLACPGRQMWCLLDCVAIGCMAANCAAVVSVLFSMWFFSIASVWVTPSGICVRAIDDCPFVDVSSLRTAVMKVYCFGTKVTFCCMEA